MTTKIQQLKETVRRFFAGQKTAGMQTEDINANEIKAENIAETEVTAEKHGLREMKEIVKQMGAMQRMLKEHRKTVNFKGERQTVEFVTSKSDYKNGKYVYTDQNVKIYLTPKNASQLLTDVYFFPEGTNAAKWNIPEDKVSTNQQIYCIGLIPVPGLSKTEGDIMKFRSTTGMVANFNDAYALLRYERKTKKNDYLEKLHEEVDNGCHPGIKRIMDYFRDDDVEKKEE